MEFDSFFHGLLTKRDKLDGKVDAKGDNSKFMILRPVIFAKMKNRIENRVWHHFKNCAILCFSSLEF
jgi:hypothetical protein